jgi:hypothetical protein
MLFEDIASKFASRFPGSYPQETDSGPAWSFASLRHWGIDPVLDGSPPDAAWLELYGWPHITHDEYELFPIAPALLRVDDLELLDPDTLTESLGSLGQPLFAGPTLTYEGRGEPGSWLYLRAQSIDEDMGTMTAFVLVARTVEGGVAALLWPQGAEWEPPVDLMGIPQDGGQPIEGTGDRPW